MVHQNFATAWAALLALEAPTLSAFLLDAAAYQEKQARSAGGVQPKPHHTSSKPPGFVSGCAANPPLLNEGSSWPLFPAIGGDALDLAPTDRFLSCEFLRGYQSGATTLVYTAGCSGIRALVAPLKLLVFKLGTHTAGDLSIRMRQLNLVQYASQRQTGGNGEAGYGSWMIQPLQPRSAEAASGSPVRIRNDALEIVLPTGLTNAKFDQQLNRALCTATLENFVRSRAGDAYCKARGVDPASLLRGTNVGKNQPESARELVLFRPHQDLHRLVRVCEDLIYQHVIEAAAEH